MLQTEKNFFHLICVNYRINSCPINFFEQKYVSMETVQCCHMATLGRNEEKNKYFENCHFFINLKVLHTEVMSIDYYIKH